MIELLSLVLGGGLRLVPEVLKLFTASGDRAHEYKMRELDLQIAKSQTADRIRELDANAKIALDQGEIEALVAGIKAQAIPTGFRFIDALSASVRPVVTYWWMTLYTIVKVSQIMVQLDMGVPTLDALMLTWHEFDNATLGSLLGFWFADRALRKVR